MKILIAADTRTGSLMGSYRRAFERLGHEVRGLSPDQAAARSRSPWLKANRIPFVNRLALEPLVLEGNRILTADAIAWRPELLLTAGIDILPGTLATVSAATDCTSVAIFPDTLLNLQPSLLAALPLYDLVVYGCGRFGLPYLERLGARRTSYLPFAWDEELHPRPAHSLGDAEAPFDVVFVGNWRPDREALIEHLGEFRLAIWGSDYWRTRSGADSVARRAWRGRTAEGGDFARASRSGKIALNLVDVTNGPGLNMRAFEAVGVGSFVLSTRTPALEELFIEGEHIAYFSSGQELRDKVRYYLDRPEERLRITATAVRFADMHTYLRRAQELLCLTAQS